MIIGKNTETNESITIDLARLIATRLLIQANSGAGKSWAIRRILEQTYGKVQQIVIDLEGEFSTLREKYDYLLVGKDGEIPANIQTAELLAIKLLKLNVSTIIDLSELQKHERVLFVKRFLDSLVNASRELWHTCLIIVDEAHQFCPEGAKSESTSSVIDLQTRGRKRGFCGVLATQRISKLNKDAAAECNNVMVGRTVIDIDRKRAANDLGFITKDQERSLKKLDDGEFFVYGPAISKDDYVKVKVGDVKTTHPEPGKSILKASKTPDNIKKLLKDVIDLPKEAEAELKTKKDFQNKINELKKEVRSLKISQPKPIADEKALQRAKDQGYREAENNSKRQFQELAKNYRILEKKFSDIGKIVGAFVPKLNLENIKSQPPIKFQPPIKQRISIDTPLQKVTKSNINNNISDDIDNDIKLGLCPRKIYSFLFNNPNREFTKMQLGALTGYSPKSGGFNNAIYNLNAKGLIVKQGNMISLGESNPEFATETTGEFSVELWINKLAKCPREIFKFLFENPEQEFSKEDLGEQTGYSSTSGGFNNSIYKLNSLQLINRNGSMIKLNPELLEI